MSATFPSFRLPLPTLLVAFAVGVAPYAAPAQTPSCAPSFRAIHDFQVGEEFQYRIWERDSGEAGIRRNRGTVTIRKYRIVSRADSGGTSAYGIRGIARITLTEAGNVALSHSSLAIDETLRFTDSAGHRLNRCHDDIVPYPELDFPGAHTRIRVVTADAEHYRVVPADAKLKVLGESVGILVGDTTLNPIMDVNFSLAYAEGLGLVERIEGGGMGGIWYSETLTGCVRDGKTHGVVTPDHELAVSIRAMPARKPPAAARPFAENGVPFDLRGRRLPLQALPTP